MSVVSSKSCLEVGGGGGRWGLSQLVTVNRKSIVRGSVSSVTCLLCFPPVNKST